ncbi:hypothetical protein TNIN_113691 [Trichonephila inaurata madagascariensis]|uniref:Uncharacterized protein n=1 Tax=Trichonephila inaurata madagascariensis TaxID=2747483 RepID=A0A8X6YA92_9ARAC|nr:hypothetical protein TNIN_113691 [Trichonephila inaurata madagascariensis]
MRKNLFTSPVLCNLNLLVGIDSIAAVWMTEAPPSVLESQDFLREVALLHAFRRSKKLILRQVFPSTHLNEHCKAYTQKVKMSENAAIYERPYSLSNESICLIEDIQFDKNRGISD